MRHDIQDTDGAQPVRRSASTLAMATTCSTHRHSMTRQEVGGGDQIGQEVDVYNLLIIDQHTFEVLHAHKFMDNECALSVISTRLGKEDSNCYFVVGTCFVNPDAGSVILTPLTVDLVVSLRLLTTACLIIASSTGEVFSG